MVASPIPATSRSVTCPSMMLGRGSIFDGRGEGLAGVVGADGDGSGGSGDRGGLQGHRFGPVADGEVDLAGDGQHGGFFAGEADGQFGGCLGVQGQDAAGLGVAGVDLVVAQVRQVGDGEDVVPGRVPGDPGWVVGVDQGDEGAPAVGAAGQVGVDAAQGGGSGVDDVGDAVAELVVQVADEAGGASGDLVGEISSGSLST